MPVIGARPISDWSTAYFLSGFSFTPSGNQSVKRTVSKPRPSLRDDSRAASTNRAEARTLKPAVRALEPRTTSTISTESPAFACPRIYRPRRPLHHPAPRRRRRFARPLLRPQPARRVCSIPGRRGRVTSGDANRRALAIPVDARPLRQGTVCRPWGRRQASVWEVAGFPHALSREKSRDGDPRAIRALRARGKRDRLQTMFDRRIWLRC